MDIGVATTFWLWWIMLLRTFMCRFFVRTYVFIFLGYIPDSRVAGPYGNSVFNHLKNCQTLFQSSYTISSGIMYRRVLIAPHPPPHLLLSVVFILPHFFIIVWILQLFCSFQDFFGCHESLEFPCEFSYQFGKFCRQTKKPAGIRIRVVDYWICWAVLPSYQY